MRTVIKCFKVSMEREIEIERCIQFWYLNLVDFRIAAVLVPRPPSTRTLVDHGRSGGRGIGRVRRVRSVVGLDRRSDRNYGLCLRQLGVVEDLLMEILEH